MRERLRRIADRARGIPPVVHSAPARPPAVALTFDDGPSRWTLGVAEALERAGGAGTFFMRGEAVVEMPDVARALAAAGHEVANHLWSHSDPDEQSPQELADEVERTADAIADATGALPSLVRPPYCGAPREVARAARGAGVRAIVLRSVDPADWSGPPAEEIAHRVLAKVGPGDIVCMHDGMPVGSSGSDTRAPTVAAVEIMLPELARRGLEPVTVSRLLAWNPR